MGFRTRDKKEHQPVRMRDAALIQLGSKYASVGVQLVVTAVLARLILPEDFGVLAIVAVFAAFFSMFSDMGVGAAIVQFKDLDDFDFGRLFGFSCCIALCLAGFFCLASMPIAWIYGDERLVPMCCLASVSLLCSTMNMVPNGLMLRRKKFPLIGLRLIVATAVSGAIGIALAVLGWGCYALVMQMIVSSLIVLVWNLMSNPVRHITLRFMPSVRKVFSYSAYQFGFGLVNYFNRTLDNLLIGKFLGAAPLGYYDKAYKLTTYPMSAFSSVIASVIQPYMAEHQDDPDRIFESWMRISKLFSMAGATVGVVFFCCSEEIIAVMYGEQWGASVPLFQALSVSVYAQMMGNPAGAFFQSLGRTDLMFRCGLVNSCMTVVALLVGLSTGSLDVVAWCITAAFCVQLTSLAYFLVKKGFGKPVTSLRAFLPEVGAGVVAGAAGLLAGIVLPKEFAIQFVGKLIVVGIVLLVIFWIAGDLRHLKTLIVK